MPTLLPSHFSPSSLFFPLLLLLLGQTAILHAQSLQVSAATTPPFTPQNLISNVFLGDGVEVTNIVYNGEPQAVGYFTGGASVIGIERGIIMTSGRVESQGAFTVGAAETGTDFASTQNDFFPTPDADLAPLTTSTLFDLASYTITFIPTSDTLRFRYVFASEEYPEYSCSSFNDVFGFFIQGPGYPMPTNIAKVPVTGESVTINNVHPANGPGCNPKNIQFYNDNNFTGSQPSYDGYLDVFIAEAVVVPCQTYTIKLAIADVSDGVFDSGVFLEAKSFGTGSLKVDVATVSNDGTVTEGCSQGLLTFTLPNEATSDYPIDYHIWGPAINGTDYETIATDLKIPAGQQVLNVPIIALEDNIAETGEFIAIDVKRDPCNRDTFYIYLRDNSLIQPGLRPDTSICLNAAPLELDGTVNIPLPPPPTFTNDQDFTIAPVGAPVFSPINVFGVQPTILTDGVIRSVCMNITHSWDDDLYLYLLSPGGQFVELSTHNGADGNNYTNTCFTPTASKVISSPGPFAPASAAPFTGDWLPEGVFPDLWDGDYPTNGQWRLELIDKANGFTGTLKDWTITFEPTYKITYQWFPQAGLSCPTCPITDATPTQTTLYTVRATDSYGCVVQDSVRVAINPELAAPSVQCISSTSNSITFGWNNVPGSSGYQVNTGNGWVPVGTDTTYTVNGLSLNSSVTLQVSGIDGVNQCTALIDDNTCVNCNAPVLSVSTQPASCAGAANGSATITTDNLNPPYTFALPGHSNGTGIFALTGGTYVATVTDATGCASQINFTVDAPAAMAAQATVAQDALCFGGNSGQINTTVTGGTGIISYLWNDPSSQNAANAVNLTAGTYTVTATDMNGCTATASASITQPTEIILNAQSTDALCQGQASGTAMATASGGVSPYDFQWDDGQTTPTATDLFAGVHVVTLTDANGCAKTAFLIVGQPAALTATISAEPTSCAAIADGQITVTPQGGVSGYSYLWSDPLGQTTQTASNLSPLSYTVTITDANGCTLEQSAEVTAPPALTLSLVQTNAKCNGEASGAVTTTVGGGTGADTYLWSNGASSPALSGVVAGTYTVTVTDENGCTISKNTTVSQPTAIALTATVKDAACFGQSNGSINLSVQGGKPGYTYQWSSNETSEDVSGKPAGSYTVTVTDANGCTAVLSKTVAEPTALTSGISATMVKCYGQNTGELTLTATGGTGNFNVQWTGPNGYTGTGSTITGLFAGGYTATVTDANGCSEVQNVLIGQPVGGLTLSLPESADTICFGTADGTATVNVTGGTSPYTYHWNANGIDTPTATGLVSNFYEVVVTDGNGCTQTASTFIAQQQQLNAFATAGTPSCHGSSDGSASVSSIFYGIDPADPAAFTYVWNTTPAQHGQQAAGLTAGVTYLVTVTDAQGCSATASATISDQPEVFASISGSADVLCNGEHNGSAEAVGSGGNAPYSYFWSGNAGGQTTAKAVDLRAGVYHVTVTDANGCAASADVTIGEPLALKINVLGENVLCFGESTGAAHVEASGGVAPYAYQWNTGAASAALNNLAAGLVQVSLTDANGCLITDSVTIGQPAAPLSGTATKQDAGCFGAYDGRVVLTGAGGSPPYRYTLDNKPFNGSSIQIGLGAGTYVPQLVDHNGCTVSLPPIEVVQRPPVQVELGPDITISLGENTQLLAQISDALAPFTISWDARDSSWLSCLDCLDPFVDSLFYQNSFEIRVVDSAGCAAEDRIVVHVEKPRRIFVPTGFTPNGDGNNDILMVHGQSSARLLDFRVYDRWGELLYQASDFAPNDTSVGWDGTFRGSPMNPGVYVWMLEAQYLDGAKEVLKGNTMLIR